LASLSSTRYVNVTGSSADGPVAAGSVAAGSVASGAAVCVTAGAQAANTNANRHKILTALENIQSFFMISSEIFIDV
jgi:hypothetical protein